jgi:hypothetical protein
MTDNPFQGMTKLENLRGKRPEVPFFTVSVKRETIQGQRVRVRLLVSLSLPLLRDYPELDAGQSVDMYVGEQHIGLRVFSDLSGQHKLVEAKDASGGRLTAKQVQIKFADFEHAAALKDKRATRIYDFERLSEGAFLLKLKQQDQ